MLPGLFMLLDMFEFERMFEFDIEEFPIDEFDIDELPIDEFDMFEFDIDEFDIDEFMFDIEVLVMLVFIRLALVALLAPLSPHAIQRAPKAKTVESAITFLITKRFSCLLQR